MVRPAVELARARVEGWRSLTPPGPIALSDAFTVTAGCDKRFPTCRERFANVGNLCVFPHIPANDFVISYPVPGKERRERLLVSEKMLAPLIGNPMFWINPYSQRNQRHRWLGQREDLRAPAALQQLSFKYEGQPRDEIGRYSFGRQTNRLQTAARRISPALEAFCENQYTKDVFQCRMVGLAACYAQASLRYANCLRGLPIPPLNY